jgi:hypothetical protein
MAGIPLEYKWSKFYVKPHTPEEENAIFKKFNWLSTEDFIFVHDDPDRKRVFKKNLVPLNIRKLRPVEHLDVPLFDFVPLIKLAKEVHVNNSSFSALIDTMQLKQDNIFWHVYARNENAVDLTPTLKLNWTLYK